MSSLPILPSDLIIEILSWLPAKSLVRFRRVSKYWKSLISNTTFAKLHLQRSPKHTHTLLTSSKKLYLNGYKEYYWVLTPYTVRPLLEHPSSILIEDECRRFQMNSNLGSANGLVCLISISDISLEDKYKKFWVQFWNPTLRLTSKNSPSLIIPDDPNLGFGYDALNDTYKVVAVFWNPTTQEMEGRVHCMGDSCWRKIVACPSFPTLRYDNLIGSFVSGNVNWLALHNSNSHEYEYEWEDVTINQLAIFSLDIQKETCKYMLLPDGFSELPEDEPRLAVLRGHLCFYDYMRTHFVLWEMREFGVHESWTQLVNVSYAHLQIEEPYRLLLPVCLSENGDVLMLANSSSDDVVMYNQRDNRIEYVELPNQIFYAHEHMQSLVLPRPCPH